MVKYVRFSITVRDDQYEHMRDVENRSGLIRLLLDQYFKVHDTPLESLQADVTLVNKKLDLILNSLGTKPSANPPLRV